MARHKTGKKKKKKKYMSGSVQAVAVTKLKCTDANRKGLETIARDVVQSSCIDRSAFCTPQNRVIVTATCPTPGARLRFTRTVEKFGKILQKVK